MGDGTMLMPGGGFAVMEPNETEFEKAISKEKGIIGPDVVVPSALKCPICGELFNNAVLIPCCGASFCDQCKLMK